MSSSAKCRFGLNIGLDTISFVKIETEPGNWKIEASGEIPLGDASLLSGLELDGNICALLEDLFRQQRISNESVHLTLDSSFCVSRVATGDRKQVESQLSEVIDNSQHYLQMGLGEKLIGKSIVDVDALQCYGHVAIVKCGLIESIERALHQLELDIDAIDCELTAICRLAGVSQLDDESPLLLIWLGHRGAQIGISHKGRLQLNYHAGVANTVEDTARTIGKHLKRLKRFCNRYRGANASADLTNVLVLADPQRSAEMREHLSLLGFEQVLTLKELLAKPALNEHLDETGTSSSTSASAVAEKLSPMSETLSVGAASALGGLLVYVENDVLPPTSVYENYLRAKPQVLIKTLLRDYWLVLVSAAVLAGLFASSRWLHYELRDIENEIVTIQESFNQERSQLVELTESQSLLEQYRRLEDQLRQVPPEKLIVMLASCLPEDTRLDRLSIEANDQLKMKGTALNGDRSYELVSALRRLPIMSDVSLESVDKSSNTNGLSTHFQIQCQLTPDVANAREKRVATGSGEKNK